MAKLDCEYLPDFMNKNIKNHPVHIIDDMIGNRMVFILFKQVSFPNPRLWWRIGGGR